MEEEAVIRVGSRKSQLALIQTRYVIGRLQKLYPEKKFEIHTMSTMGDRVLNISLPKIGEKSLFTRDLEDSLRSGGIDFVVHSLKDLPTSLPTGMVIGAVLEREDPRDALVLREEFNGHTIDTLPKGSIIGTSSLRRTAQLKMHYPHLLVCDIRGNLNTRLAKLDAPESRFAGILLAEAGLERMGWTKRVNQILEPSNLMYAVGQGALAVECRGNDINTLQMLQSLLCIPTTCRIIAERSFLKTLGGGCSAPVAVWSSLTGETLNGNGNCSAELTLTGAVWSLDGSIEIRDKQSCIFQKEMARRISLCLEDLDENSNSNNSSYPPRKKHKNNDHHDNDNENGNDNSPPIINEDKDIEILKDSYEVKELIEKHAKLAKICPVVGQEANENLNKANCIKGGGDAADPCDNRCPLHLTIGQDVMGNCPFVDLKEKVEASGSHCLENIPSTSKCPHMQLVQQKDQQKLEKSDVNNDKQQDIGEPNEKNNNNNNNNNKTKLNSINISTTKCPFLQKSIQIIEYRDEDKPLPKELPQLTDIDNLFCGIYKHNNYSQELFEKCNQLGEDLANLLVKEGALEVMREAQAEVHSKA